jgi:GTP cyclohydrolase II
MARLTLGIVAFREPDSGVEQTSAILVGRPEQAEAPLVRIHSECFTGDLWAACAVIAGRTEGRHSSHGRGWCGRAAALAQEGRGIGLVNKLRAYAMQDRGSTCSMPTGRLDGARMTQFPACRDHAKAIGIPRVRRRPTILKRLHRLSALGIEVVNREDIPSRPTG